MQDLTPCLCMTPCLTCDPLLNLLNVLLNVTPCL